MAASHLEVHYDIHGELPSIISVIEPKAMTHEEMNGEVAALRQESAKEILCELCYLRVTLERISQ
jgi:hypothetical protein